MKQILLLILLTASNDVLAQERIDTLYYNRSGSVVPSPAFAEYYRIALYPADSAGSKMFRDFYISGELRTEGHFQTIDTLDDRRTVFDGKIVSYFKNGRISEKSYYSGGLLEGEYLQYDENGMLKTRASYARGELSGTYETYGEDGSYLKMEYQAGKPIHDYYLLADGEGHSFKVRIADDMTIWESPDITERLVDYRTVCPGKSISKTD
jgi:MORN repeat protein